MTNLLKVFVPGSWKIGRLFDAQTDKYLLLQTILEEGIDSEDVDGKRLQQLVSGGILRYEEINVAQTAYMDSCSVGS